MSAGAIARLRRRRARALRHRLRLAAPPGQRALPGRLPAGHGARPAADRPAPRRGRRARGRRRGRPRLHRQGQRPGPLRRRGPRPRSGARGHRPDARRHGPVARPGDRLRDRARHRDPDHEGLARTRSTSTCGAARARRASSRTRGSRRRPTPTSGPSRRATRPTRSRSSIGFEGGIPVALDGERLGAGGAGRAAPRARRRPRRRPHRPRRGPARRHQEPRDLRDARRPRSCTRAHRALEGLTLSKDTLRFNRVRRRRAGPAHLRRPLVQRPAARPARRTWRRRSASSPARSGCGSTTATPSSPGGASPLSLYDKSLATYDEGDAFDHAAAVGFIEIFGLPLRIEAARHGAVGKHHGAAWTWTDPLLEDLPTTVDRSGAGAV